MAATKYEYTKAIDIPRLSQEIRASSITIALDYISVEGADAVDIWFKEAISAGEKTTLDGLVTAHVNDPLPNVEPQKDSDGAYMMRPKVTKSGRTFQARLHEFTTSLLDSGKSMGWDGANTAGEVAMKFYDINDVELSSPTQADLDANCYMTEVDINFTFAYEIFRAAIWIENETSEDCRGWCRMLPDVPYAAGGEREMLRGFNVKFIQRKTEVMFDGAAPKDIPTGQFPGSHFRLRFRHNRGHQVSFMANWELFK